MREALRTPPSVTVVPRRVRAPAAMWTAVLAAAVVAAALGAVALGPVPIAPGTVAAVVGHHVLGIPGEPAWTTAEHDIVWLIRLPRVLLGVVVGAGLAVAGVAVQAIVRNPLADPYLLGITSGASTGAAAAILFGVGAGLGAASLSGSAFLGAVAATAAVFGIARLGGGPMTSSRLVLAGVAVGYGLSAATSFLIVAADTRDGARAVLFWLLGSLDQARWTALPLPVAGTVVSLLALLLWSRRLDALSIGDETARALGTSPSSTRNRVLAVVALGVATVVAASGSVGFVGLVVPHLARRLVRGDHRAVLPVAAAAGALLVVVADVVARIAFQPREIPLGIVTALIGVPWLVVLVSRLRGPL